jgi:hypothetical protein
MTFQAHVYGGHPDVKITYTWSVSAGKVSRGQGTSMIAIDASVHRPSNNGDGFNRRPSSGVRKYRELLHANGERCCEGRVPATALMQFAGWRRRGSRAKNSAPSQVRIPAL